MHDNRNPRLHFSRRALATRAGAALLMIALIAWGYWWLILAAAAVFLFIYRSYYEILLWGICFDAIYAPPSQNMYDYHIHLGFLIAVVLLFAGVFLKKRLAFYS